MRKRHWPCWLGLLGLLGSSLVTALAFAQTRREPPILFGGGRPRPKPVVTIDPRLPTGTRLGEGARRPPASSGRTCSFRRPVCVQPAAGVAGETTLKALSALEGAYERLVLVLALPPPLPDFEAGGSDALDLYLGDREAPLLVSSDAMLPGPFDQASAFCTAGTSDAALLERAATQCVGEAIARRLDAGEAPHLQRAFATALFWLTSSPTSLDVQAIDDVQAEPERAIAAGRRSRLSEGAAMFFHYLEEARSESDTGVLSTSLLAAAASKTPSTAAAFDNEPDLFDVLRHTHHENPAKMASLLANFAVARAFIGDREDGLHLPGLGFAGSFGRARFDWVIPFSSLPRRVLSGRPVEPTGTELIWVTLDEVPLGVALGFRAEWEAPVSFQWQLVTLHADGRELQRIDVPHQERATSAEARVVKLDGAAAVLVVGTNLEGVDLAHPFDPDVEPFEPHACTVYLAKM
jgi:hypothetical protein